MKEKLRKFYEDHKYQIIAGAAGSIVTAAGMVFLTKNHRTFTCADLYVRDDGMMSAIVLTRKNGGTKVFLRYLEDGVPELAKMLAVKEGS